LAKKRPNSAQDDSAIITLLTHLASYFLSYSIVGIIWVNHHHRVRHTRAADALVIWSTQVSFFLASCGNCVRLGVYIMDDLVLTIWPFTVRPGRKATSSRKPRFPAAGAAACHETFSMV